MCDEARCGRSSDGQDWRELLTIVSVQPDASNMMVRNRRGCGRTALFVLTLSAACQCGSGQPGIALCEQEFRIAGQDRALLGAGCVVFDDAYGTTFTSEPTASPDLEVVGVAYHGGWRVTATSGGTTVGTGALSPPQLKSHEKLILEVKTVGGHTYEFRYWGVRYRGSLRIDPAEYLDGIDAGWIDGGFK
jgi:hypothetical protein